MARGAHELLATGPAARLGTLAPHLTTTTTISADGRPLEVRLPLLLALWLVLGCLVPADDVVDLYVFHYIVGAERLGTALDLLLDQLDVEASAVLTPSLLRRKLLELGTRMREANSGPFTVTLACLLVVGGPDDDLAAPLLPRPCRRDQAARTACASCCLHGHRQGPAASPGTCPSPR